MSDSEHERSLIPQDDEESLTESQDPCTPKEYEEEEKLHNSVLDLPLSSSESSWKVGFAHGRRLTLRFSPQEVPEDHKINLRAQARTKHIPSKVDLRHLTGPVRDQGTLGCCVSFTLASVARYLLAQHKDRSILFSPLFLYFETRRLAGATTAQDSGSTLAEGLRALRKVGIAKEKYWPFNPKYVSRTPSDKAYRNARKHRVVTYAPVAQDLTSIQSCLAAGFLVNVGIQIYESIESDRCKQSGIVNLPRPGEQPLGGHAIVLVGYNNEAERFILQNSWGETSGQEGYFTIPYRYILSSALCSELFCVTDFA